MATTRTRLGSGPTLVVLAGLLAGLGSTVSTGSSTAEGPGSAAPRTEAPVDGGSAHDLALPDLQGPGLDGAELPADAEVAVQSAKTGSTQRDAGHRRRRQPEHPGPDARGLPGRRAHHGAHRPVLPPELGAAGLDRADRVRARPRAATSPRPAGRCRRFSGRC